ncbi:MAG: hypothetical protein WA160_14820 [Pseudobdellovibrio sp.]
MAAPNTAGGSTSAIATEAKIISAYHTLLMREPDAVGLKYWVDRKIPLKDIE